MSNNFKQYIKAVGTGPRHNHDLTQEQMSEAMGMILDKEVYPEQVSAFLLGWRLKPETIDEFKGTLDAIDQRLKKKPIENSIELGYPYDGKRNNPFLFPLIAQILQPHGINVVVTVDKLQPAKEGVTAQDIANNITTTSNLHVFNRADICKPLSDLTDIRMKLGIRTGLNTVERLINPSNSEVGFVGVFHKPFMEKYANMFSPRYNKLFVVKGNEGTSEVYSKCQYWIAEHGITTEHTIDPKDFGITYEKSWERISLEESLDLLQNPTPELFNIAKLNSALILYAMGRVNSVEEGYELLNS